MQIFRRSNPAQDHVSDILLIIVSVPHKLSSFLFPIIPLFFSFCFGPFSQPPPNFEVSEAVRKEGFLWKLRA